MFKKGILESEGSFPLLNLYLEKVLHQAIVRYLEDWSVWVLVDGHYDLAVLHPGQMLDGPRDAHSYVQFLRASVNQHVTGDEKGLSWRNLQEQLFSLSVQLACR